METQTTAKLPATTAQLSLPFQMEVIRRLTPPERRAVTMALLSLLIEASGRKGSMMTMNADLLPPWCSGRTAVVTWPTTQTQVQTDFESQPAIRPGGDGTTLWLHNRRGD